MRSRRIETKRSLLRPRWPRRICCGTGDGEGGAGAAGFGLNLVTSFGPLDVTYRPDGTGGYADLAQSVVIVNLLGVDVPIASLEDIIRSKEAAGRPKDIAVLPALIEHSRVAIDPSMRLGCRSRVVE